MILRILLAGMMALGLAGFGTIAAVALAPSHPAATHAAPAPTQAVVGTAHALRAGALIKPDDLAPVEVPHDKMPEGALVDSPATRIALVGAMVRRPLPAGITIGPEDLLRPGDHGFLAAVLKPGKRAVTVAVDAVSGSAGLIWPGDEVDCILTQVIDVAGVAPGRKVAAETVLHAVRVIAIDQQLAGGPTPDGKESQARTVTLETTTAEAEKVQVAARIGRLSLVVRATDPGAALRPANLNQPTWAGDVSHALDGRLQASGSNTVRVFTGSADAKEFRF